MSDLTTNTHTIPELRDILSDRLQSSTETNWNVKQYTGTTAPGLIAAMMALNLPAAVVCWAGEDAHKEPGRPQRTYNLFHVFLLAANGNEDDAEDVAQDMLDDVKNLIDNHTNGNTVWRYQHAEPVDLSDASQAPNVSCIDVTIEVGDH